MKKPESDSRKQTGSIKEAFNLYGERIIEGICEQKKTQKALAEPPSRARELHIAKREMGQFEVNKKVAESVKAQADYELFNVQKTVKDLNLRIGESKSKAKARKRELETLKKNPDGTAPEMLDNHQYEQVMRELEFVKQELSKLKLDMASVLEAKLQADKESEASVSKMRSYSSSVQALRKEIKVANDEQVLVELARIEATKELQAIEAQREAEAIQFSSTMKKTKKRIKGIIRGIDRSKEVEMKLAMTTDDVDVLQNELKLVKEMEKRVQGNENLEHVDVGKRREEGSERLSLLQSATEELEVAKNELECIREEGFQFMASMDIIRSELKHVTEEMARLKNSEGKADLIVHNLNHKLVRAKYKLEASSAAEERAKAIVSNLTITLQQLQTDAEAAKKERELITEETASIQTEIQKTKYETDLTEEMLECAMKELKEVKASEAIALESLKTLTEKTMRSRASASHRNSSITISNFEYEYLSGRAVGAEEIADKKVAAAQMWIEALKASEKEILMKTEIAQREIKEQRAMGEQEMHRTEKSQTSKKEPEGDLVNWKEHEKQSRRTNLQRELALPRKSMKDNGIPTPMKRSKPQRPSSPGVWQATRPPSPVFSLKKKGKVMSPKLVKFFSSKNIE